MPGPHTPLTVKDYDDAILYLAECVVAHGARFSPILEKLIAGRDALVQRPDPIERARAIIEAARNRSFSDPIS
ncbi:hypothetical protein [Bosea sp. TND4EK4]|uniref:hypothetical protein n=1 Tax=Bosea sp. TND4EK4 TaxID=1907408 RepID=UPI000955187B|nr:hypothetical protein [Bosea sp. TND4EK4]SIQ59932.1 hypothetical protein SAMN05880592_10488 [Bosea sp. TND4EK4]